VGGLDGVDAVEPGVAENRRLFAGVGQVRPQQRERIVRSGWADPGEDPAPLDDFEHPDLEPGGDLHEIRTA